MAIVTRYFGVRTVATGAISLVYDEATKTITRASGSFVDDGFQVGDTVAVTGTSDNNGALTLTDVAALVLTVTEDLVDETVSSTVTLTTGDGTSWAKRALLFSSGNWSDIIIGFDFASDTLVARIEGGLNYDCSQELSNTTITGTTTFTHPIILHGCDSNGDLLVPPYGWKSAQPPWDDSALPVIRTTTNIQTIGRCIVALRMLKLTASGRVGSITTDADDIGHIIDWCHIINTNKHSSARCVYGPVISNSVTICSQDTFDYVISTGLARSVNNCRVIGGGAGGSGNRIGITWIYGTDCIYSCTISGCAGGGIVAGTTIASRKPIIVCCTVVNKVGHGILSNNGTSPTALHQIINCYIADCDTGIDSRNGLTLTVGSRVAGNTNNFSDANQKDIPYDIGNDTSAWDDSELVSYDDTAPDPMTDDYRIAATSAFWGKGYGAGDEIPTAATIATAVWARTGRSLTT